MSTTPKTRVCKLVTLIVFFTLSQLTGCGGGGGTSDATGITVANPPTSTDPAIPVSPDPVSPDPVSPAKVGFQIIDDQAWDDTAVRRVLNTFAYGGHASDQQIQAWADMPPQNAIQEILTFDPHNDKLSPPEDATRSTNGTLEALQGFWSRNSVDNPVRPDRRNKFDLLMVRPDGVRQLSKSALQRTWVQASTTRGLNTFRQKTGLFMTNYLAAVSIVEMHSVLERSYYDDVMTALEEGRDFADVLAQAASSAAVSIFYGHYQNKYVNLTNGPGVFFGNDDFAREFHQLFFRIMGTTEDADYHENTSIEHTAWILAGMDVDSQPGAYGSGVQLDAWLPGIIFEDHIDPAGLLIENFSKHYLGCLEVYRTDICGMNAEAKLSSLAKIAIQHQESLDNLPVFIINFFADDNLSDSKIKDIRDAWKQMDSKNLLEFLREYATSTTFHREDTVKYRTAFDRNLVIDNLAVLNNEEKFAYWSLPHGQMQLEGAAVFFPSHAVFGGQTGLEAATNSDVFRLAYARNVQQSFRLGLTKLAYPGPDNISKTWLKDWAQVMPADGNGGYVVADVGQWLWERFIGDGGKNYDALARAHVEALLDTGLDLNSQAGQVNSQATIALNSSDPGQREEANRRVGLAVNFITMTPYIFAQEGK